MKKFFFVVAIAGIMTSCKDKKDEKKVDEPTITTPTTTTEPTTTSATTGVPTFSDPEVQKFANDYGAFITEYKAGMKDPAKLAVLAKTMQDWSSKAQNIGMKLATTPDEAKKWADWVTVLAKEIMPEMPSTPK